MLAEAASGCLAHWRTKSRTVSCISAFSNKFGCAKKAKYYGLSPLFSEQRASVLGCSDVPMTGELATCWGLQAWY